MSEEPKEIEDHAPLSRDLLLRLQSQTRKVLGDIAALFERGTITDETDRKFIMEAFGFIENPTENLSDAIGHTTHIGEVFGGYEMQGADPPPAIDAMHGYLWALQCIGRIKFIETALDQGSAGSSEVQHAMVMALQDAGMLLSAYKDGTFLGAVNELKSRLGNP